MMFRGSGIKGLPIGLGNPHQSALPLLTTSPTTLLQMSSVTFFESSDCENTLQFWEGASSGLATQSPRRECHPSTRPVFVRLDTLTPTGPACQGVPQTRRPHTGDKDQNTHQAHAGYIGSTDNKVTPMCPVGIGWVHFKRPLPWDSNLPRPEQAGYI